METRARKIVKVLAESMIERKLKLATAESCTGGWVAKMITDLPGSSAWFERGFITYSNESKREQLQVSLHTLNQYGAVSEQTAQAMAFGALMAADAEVSLSVTGIAGPEGGTPEKPVGTVCFAWEMRNSDVYIAETVHFKGDRDKIRIQSVEHALSGVLRILTV